jgi:hypothetical protein
MKIKISNQNPTSHIFIALMKYCLDHQDEDCRYGFGCFEMDVTAIQRINRFHDEWEKGIRNYKEVIVDIPEFYLIDEKYIYDEVEGKESSDFKGVKLDSLNFLEGRPELGASISRKCKGSIVLNRNNFIVQAEIILEGSYYSFAIFRSSRVNYWKINHLLDRETPL